MVRNSADLATTVDLLLPVLDGHWTRTSLKRDEIARTALSFFLLVDQEELLTRCIAVLFSSEGLVRLLPTALLTALALAKPVPEFVFAGPSGASCVSTAALCLLSRRSAERSKSSRAVAQIRGDDDVLHL